VLSILENVNHDMKFSWQSSFLEWTAVYVQYRYVAAHTDDGNTAPTKHSHCWKSRKIALEVVITKRTVTRWREPERLYVNSHSEDGVTRHYVHSALFCSLSHISYKKNIQIKKPAPLDQKGTFKSPKILYLMTEVESISEMSTKVWEGKKVQNNGSQSVIREFQRIREQFPGDPWIRFCNDYLKLNYFFNESDNDISKTIAKLL